MAKPWGRGGRTRARASSGERRAVVSPRPPSEAHGGHRAATGLEGRALVVAGVSAAGGLTLLVLVTVGWEPLLAVDRWVTDALHRVALDAPWWTWINRVLTDWVWSPDTMRLLALATLVAQFCRGCRRIALWVAVTSLLGLAAQHAIKAAVGRERPAFPDPVDSAHGWAFPSGHVMAATVTCGLLLILVLRGGTGRRVWRAAAWTIAVVSVVGVGGTRVYLGVHWASDVLGGWLFGGAVVAVGTAWVSPWSERKRPSARQGGSAPASEALTRC